MTKLSKLAAVLAAVPVLAISGAALADSPGQLGSGAEVYNVKNLTQGGGYANTISAKACDQVEYKVLLHNTSFGGFSNVHVAINLPSSSSTSNVSTVTATTNLGGTTGTNGTATVNLSSAQTVSYQNGTATLYDVNGTVIKTLPDAITQSSGWLPGSYADPYTHTYPYTYS
jgi:hypothetical protein